MKIYNTAHQFYNSTEFRTLRRELMNTRQDADGILRCAYCGKPLLVDYETIAHHVQEITAANLNNPEITLNPDNIQLVHLHCHNAIHGRFGYSVKKVYIVHGAPCAGKSTFVNAEKSRNDLIIDIDLIWNALTGGRGWDKPDELKANVFGVYNELLQQVKTRAGKWQTAYIVSAEPRRAKRDRMAAELNAEMIYIPCERSEALKRLQSDTSREGFRDKWTEYINNYFENEEV